MGTSASSDRLLQALTALSLLVTPVLVAVIGYRATNSSTSKDYVSLAVSILNAKDSTKESRQWATTVLNKLSPVPVPDSLKQQLGNGSGLTATTVTRFVPVASPPIDCPSKETFAKIRSVRPIRPSTKGKTREQAEAAVALFAAEMDAYANYTLGVLNDCSRLSDTWKKMAAEKDAAKPQGAEQK